MNECSQTASKSKKDFQKKFKDTLDKDSKIIPIYSIKFLYNFRKILKGK
ncbi:hypothetical protein cco10_05848 [Campylobacter coli 90-3]|nr:hypothetical protein cco10_05848 [Campylobacter coli 90-3]